MRLLVLSVVMTGIAVTAAAADRVGDAPQLVRDTTVRSGDSVLVRAAKRTVAARRRATGTSVVIDNARVARAKRTLTGPTGPAPATSAYVPVNRDLFPADDPSLAAAAEERAAREAEVRERKQELNDEMERMAAETLEEQAGEVEEDQIDQRLGTIPDELRRLNEPPPPPPSQQ